MTVAAEEPLLSKNESDTLRACEEKIELYARSFYDAGIALLKIRDDRLYRGVYTRFEDYCVVRWGMSDTHANRQIAAAQVVDALKTPDEDVSVTPVGVVPAAESQARELVSLLEQPRRLRAVWRKAVEIADGHVPTAAKVIKARDEFRTPEEIQAAEERRVAAEAKREAARQAEINAAILRDRDKRLTDIEVSPDSESEPDLGAPGPAESVEITDIRPPSVASAKITRADVISYFVAIPSHDDLLDLIRAIPALMQIAKLGAENKMMNDELARLNKELRKRDATIEKLKTGDPNGSLRHSGSLASEMESAER